MSSDNVYESLAEATDDSRWAFGTGFDDPLAGVDTTVPSDVDGHDLAAYCLMLGDDALVFSHRLQQWCTNAPELEDEVAIANIALDLLGQARLLLTRAGTADGSGRGEDHFAFFRAEREFRNIQLVERPLPDFAHLNAAVLVFSAWRLELLRHLSDSRDPVLAAIAAKSVKELTYHRDYAARWVVRLGDGTDLSRRRMRDAVQEVWPWLDELFRAHQVESRLAEVGIGVNPGRVRAEHDAVLDQVLAAATLERPEAAPRVRIQGRAGRDGVHTESMGYLLAELQSVARAHPEATW